MYMKKEETEKCPICGLEHKVMTVGYHAYAGTNPIYEIYVIRKGLPGNMKIVSTEPTGRTFKDTEDACNAMVKRNCE